MNLAVISLIGFVLASSSPPVMEHYDGNWWLTLTPDQQYEFVNGGEDCTSSDLKQPYTFKGSLYGLRDAISVWYQSHPASLSEKVLFVAHRPLPPQPGWHERSEGEDAGAEVYPEKHGIFDSRYYQEADFNRAFFVMGYLDCRVTYFHDLLHHPVDYYVQQLDDWFGYFSQPDVSPQQDAYQERHSGQKIGTVLDLIVRSEQTVTTVDTPKQ